MNRGQGVGRDDTIMTYRRKAKRKDDLNKNPETVDISMGEYWLRTGKVKYLKKNDIRS